MKKTAIVRNLIFAKRAKDSLILFRDWLARVRQGENKSCRNIEHRAKIVKQNCQNENRASADLDEQRNVVNENLENERREAAGNHCSVIRKCHSCIDW